jgi:hypothetical protein
MFGRGTEVGVSIAHRKHQVENGGASAPTVIVGDDLHNELGPGGIRCSGSTSEALPGRGLG